MFEQGDISASLDAITNGEPLDQLSFQRIYLPLIEKIVQNTSLPYVTP